MAQLIVRKLDEAVKAGLRQRALRRGHSMEEEARDILRAAVVCEKRQKVGMGTWFAKHFTGIGLEKDIPEMRGQTVRPVKFKA